MSFVFRIARPTIRTKLSSHWTRRRSPIGTQNGSYNQAHGDSERIPRGHSYVMLGIGAITMCAVLHDVFVRSPKLVEQIRQEKRKQEEARCRKIDELNAALYKHLSLEWTNPEEMYERLKYREEEDLPAEALGPKRFVRSLRPRSPSGDDEESIRSEYGLPKTRKP